MSSPVCCVQILCLGKTPQGRCTWQCRLPRGATHCWQRHAHPPLCARWHRPRAGVFQSTRLWLPLWAPAEEPAVASDGHGILCYGTWANVTLVSSSTTLISYKPTCCLCERGTGSLGWRRHELIFIWNLLFILNTPRIYLVRVMVWHTVLYKSYYGSVFGLYHTWLSGVVAAMWRTWNVLCCRKCYCSS